MPSSTKYSVTYPHLTERNRIDLACDYLSHEFRKVFPDISKDMARQASSRYAPNEKRDDKTIRDFWNLFCAMSSTWRLKDLYEIVTDANMDWKDDAIPIDKLCPESPQGWMKKFGPCGRYDFNEAVAYLRKDESAIAQAMKEFEKYLRTHGIGSGDDHIIVVKQRDFYKVVDGNGRLALRIAQYIQKGEDIPYPSMNAWLGDRRGDPENRWIPTSPLFFLHQVCDEYVEQVLKSVSPLAWTEYQKRVTREIPEEE